MSALRFPVAGTRAVCATLLLLAVAVSPVAAASPPAAPAAPSDETKLTSKDGVLSLTLPSVWKKAVATNPTTVIKALNESVQICVLTENKVDVVSLEAYAKETKTSYDSYKNVQATAPVEMKLNGKTALRYDLTYDDGTYRWGVVVVCIETATRYSELTITGRVSQFNDQKDDWAKLAVGLTENPKP